MENRKFRIVESCTEAGEKDAKRRFCGGGSDGIYSELAAKMRVLSNCAADERLREENRAVK
jgi:hypothetical protein